MSNNVAEASIVLSVDATRLNAGMNKAAKDAKTKGSEIAKAFKDSSKEKIGELAGGGSIIGMGAKAGLIGAGVAAAAFAGKELYEELIVKSKEYQRELEENARAADLWAERQRQAVEDIKESLGEFSSVMGTTEGIAANERALERLRGKYDDIRSSRKSALEEEKKYDSKWNSTENFGLWLSGRLEDTAKSKADNTKRQTALEDDLRRAYEAQQKALERLKNPMTNPEARAALKDFIRSQEDAVAKLEGRTDAEQKLLDMQRKFGFKGADLAGAQAAANALKLAEANKEATDWTKNLSNELLEQAGLVKDTANLVKLDELIKKGADVNQINRIRQLMKAKQELNRQYQPLAALERGSNQEITFRRKLEFDARKRDDTLKLIGKEQLDQLKKIAAGIDKLKDDGDEI